MKRRKLLIAAVVAVVVLAVPTASYLQALSAPGSATLSMRTVDWVRAHGGNGLVNAIENWYYTRHQPADAAPDPATLPTAGTSNGKAKDTAPPAALPTLPGVAKLPGEGVWTPGRTKGQPLIYTGYLRPDPAHISIVAGVAWMRQSAVVAHLVAGTTQPDGSSRWPGNAAVAGADVPGLVATFNSGFKLADITGGFYQNGRSYRSLADGQASVVIDKQGHLTLGSWGRDVQMTGNVASVRQNLALIVDGGQPVSGLTQNANGRWGTPKNQLQYTWRSGLGIDAKGNILYVAANHINLATLAAALADAGAVRGMQLDIHPGMASFASWLPVTGSQTPHPTKLLPEMSRSASRYLVPDQRDFFYLTAR